MAIREIVELVARVTDLERRVAGVMRHGTVAEVDPGRQRMRLDFGPTHGGQGRFLSPWLPYAQFSGALRVHTPPTVEVLYATAVRWPMSMWAVRF